MSQKIKREYACFRLLLRSVPAGILSAFVLAVFSMNLLANKSISLPVAYPALDCGILVSWFAFLAMDVITNRFGPKAATQLSVFAAALNLIACAVFFIGSRLPGQWSESFVEGSEALLNGALDRTFGGTWYILAGSTAAFLVSAAVNNFLNAAIGRLLRKKPDGFMSYALRAYVSTAVGQFCDNLTFALLVSHAFFGWSLLQCVTCAVTGMAVELLCEVLFSAFGYRVCERWRREGVGNAYLEAIGQG